MEEPSGGDFQSWSLFFLFLEVFANLLDLMRPWPFGVERKVLPPSCGSWFGLMWREPLGLHLPLPSMGNCASSLVDRYRRVIKMDGRRQDVSSLPPHTIRFLVSLTSLPRPSCPAFLYRVKLRFLFSLRAIFRESLYVHPLFFVSSLFSRSLYGSPRVAHALRGFFP